MLPLWAVVVVVDVKVEVEVKLMEVEWMGCNLWMRRWMENFLPKEIELMQYRAIECQIATSIGDRILFYCDRLNLIRNPKVVLFVNRQRCQAKV